MLDCQLRKSETAKKAFEVATEKLLQFVEVMVFSSSVPLLKGTKHMDYIIFTTMFLFLRMSGLGLGILSQEKIN